MKRTLTFVAAALFSVSALADGSSVMGTGARSGGYSVGGNSKSLARAVVKSKRTTANQRNRSILDILGFTDLLDRVVEPEGGTGLR